MKFGLIIAGQYLRDGSAVERTREILEQVRLARDVGFDSVWMVHHYLIEFQAFQPVPMLGRIAAEAGEMELGTAIYVLPLQHPVEVAENFATLDALCGGRLIFGVAQGYRDVEFNALGVPRKERGPRFAEGVELITRLWTETEVDFHGRYYQVEKATLAMQPARKPRPPIWIGASEEPAIVRAARLGDAWIIGPRVDVATLQTQLRVYREALAKHGKPVQREYPIFREVVVRSTSAEARAAAAQYLRTKYEAYARWRYAGVTFEDLLRDAFVMGAPDDCLRVFERYRDEFGITCVLTRVQWPGAPHDVALRSIRVLGEQIIPKMRGR
jgi:alkanesulfonate monooxygenase SsuD/methylene tetrahydromethanopterin reductase-like flavin-dependent oxidoreductase (luciferase family)